jgi:IS5 family transposase
VLLTFYLDLSYRDMEDWLLASDPVREVLELQKVPDHTTLWRTFGRLTLFRIRRMLQELLHLLGIQENIISVDSTGFRLSQASACYVNRRGKSIGNGSKAPMPWGLLRK